MSNAAKEFSIEEALKAQRALREAAGLGPEHFPMEAFVGMISDEIQALRDHGWSDDAIAKLISDKSSIQITAEEIVENYASEESRHHDHRR